MCNISSELNCHTCQALYFHSGKLKNQINLVKKLNRPSTSVQSKVPNKSVIFLVRFILYAKKRFDSTKFGTTPNLINFYAIIFQLCISNHSTQPHYLLNFHLVRNFVQNIIQVYKA